MEIGDLASGLAMSPAHSLALNKSFYFFGFSFFLGGRKKKKMRGTYSKDPSNCVIHDSVIHGHAKCLCTIAAIREANDLRRCRPVREIRLLL